MTEHKIIPEKITRPIQLLAAWLTALIIIDGLFLLAATRISIPHWAAAVLVVASIVNVPLFLVCVFLLQTKFRPEMLADKHYLEHEERKWSRAEERRAAPDIELQSKELAEKIIKKIEPTATDQTEPVKDIIRESQILQVARRHGGKRLLSELYLRPELWTTLIKVWGDNLEFKEELDSLCAENLVELKRGKPETAKLTLLGQQVAKIAEGQGILWKQVREDHWVAEGHFLASEKR